MEVRQEDRMGVKGGGKGEKGVIGGDVGQGEGKGREWGGERGDGMGVNGGR